MSAESQYAAGFIEALYFQHEHAGSARERIDLTEQILDRTADWRRRYGNETE